MFHNVRHVSNKAKVDHRDVKHSWLRRQHLRRSSVCINVTKTAFTCSSSKETQQSLGNSCNMGIRNCRHPFQWPRRNIRQIRLNILINFPASARNCEKNKAIKHEYYRWHHFAWHLLLCCRLHLCGRLQVHITFANPHYFDRTERTERKKLSYIATHTQPHAK